MEAREVEVKREAADLGPVLKEVYAEVLSAGEIERKTILVMQP